MLDWVATKDDIADLETLVEDYLQLEAERHRNIMATIEDVKAELVELTTTIGKALADLSQTGAAGHSAVLDEVVKDVRAAKDQIKEGVAAVQVPAPPA